uniref:Peptidase M12B propeptide domain-containing protein n=1 Tax=Xiphophorus couchianus TaxID=32473 RepID=A0A3B5MS92_9TELE
PVHGCTLILVLNILLCPSSAEPLRSILDDFDVLPFSSLQTHSVRRRDVQTEAHVEKLLSFNALQRNFRLYLRTNNEIFTEDFKAIVEDEDGQRRSFPVNRHNYFTGHVIGEENSRVQAHIDDHEFSAHILTDEAEYNIEPLWRFTSAPPDGRLLIYRSEDIRNISRLQQPSVCGYVASESAHLLPEGVRMETKGRGRTSKQVGHRVSVLGCSIISFSLFDV